MIYENTKISVFYFDGGSRETTVGELRRHLTEKGESPEWIAGFFYVMEIYGSAYGKFAHYVITN